MDINPKVVATLYYGHLDDPVPLDDRVMGRVVMRLMDTPWNKLIGIPWSAKFEDVSTWLEMMKDVHGVAIRKEDIDPEVWKRWAYG